MKDNELNTHEYVNELGKFKPGNAGRPKGAVNKSTKDLKDAMICFLNDKAPEIYDMWEDLEPREKIFMYIQMAKVVLPKVTNEIEQRPEPRVFNIIQSIDKDEI